MGETFVDQQVAHEVRLMIGARHSADYYLKRKMIPQHVAFANEAERAYRAADTRLQVLGVEDNRQRQAYIHGVHILVIGWR